MIVARLELTDFRNYAHAVIELGAGVTVIVGPNGQGKTNLVESIGVLATGASHRVSSDQALVRAGTDAAVIRATLRHGDREVLIESQINRTGSNRLIVNRNPVRTREAKRYIDSVLFAPEDLAIVRGEPAGRRRTVDALLVATAPRYAAILGDYERVLRQRTALLKSARASRVAADALGTLDIWDERLAGLGAEIVAGRDRLIAALAPRADAAYTRIAGVDQRVRLRMRTSVDETDLETGGPDRSSFGPSSSDPVSSGPVSSGPPTPAPLGTNPTDGRGNDPAPPGAHAQQVATIAARLAARILEVRREELDRAVTLVGPHRDDLEIELNGLPARGYASHGESWSLALALRLASAELLRDTGIAGDPVVILDDVFAELDERRRDRLMAAVADFEQVVITAAVPADVPDIAGSRTIRIRGGAVVDDGGTADDRLVGDE